MGASGSSRHPITSWRSSPYFAGRSPLLTLLARPTQPLCSTIILNPSPTPSPPPPTPFSIRTPLVRQFHPPVSPYHLRLAPPRTIQPPSLATFPERTADHPLTLSPSRLVPSGGDENFQTPRDRNRIVISRGSRPSTIHRPNSLFLLRPWANVVPTSKVLGASTHFLFRHDLSIRAADLTFIIVCNMCSK